MPSYLDKILAHKREERRALASSPGLLADLKARAADAPPARGFRDALALPGGPHVIAEFKRASPSKGPIRPGADPADIARRYEAAGASCVSCLTDERFFQGSMDDLARVREAVSLPVIRKDFTVDALALWEARAAGADAVLLIAAALSDGELSDFSALAAELGLDALVEVHDEPEMERALALDPAPGLVGVNNRNLWTFEVDLATTERLAPMVPEGAVLVGESGIASRADAERLGRAGAKAVLVGESLMRADDPGLALRELLGGR